MKIEKTGYYEKTSASRSPQRTRSRVIAILSVLALVAVLSSSAIISPVPSASGAGSDAAEFDQNARRVPDVDVNLSKFTTRLPSTAQFRALETLKTNLSDQNITVRWDKATGSIDTIYDFASASSALGPESAARTFLEANGALFGISNISTLLLKSNVEALGGNLLYFEQTHNGIPVSNGGVGVVMDGGRRIKMVSGPYHTNLSLDTTPTLDGAAAVATAQADLAQYKAEWTSAVAAVMNPALDQLAAELGVLATPHPELNIFPTPDGPRLTYTFFLFSRNPFGMFQYQVDAATGAVLYRADQVRYQQPLPFTADIYPSSPVLANPDTGELALNENGEPKGMLRAQLRNFNPGMNATAVEGTLSGPNALVRNLLATKQPFAQALAGTFHFRANNPPLESPPNERDDLAEPAEHIDGVNNFFFINYLIEYVKHLHIAGDRQHSPFGQGHFPDTFPNSDKPLVGLVHFPSDQGLLGISGPNDTTSVETLIASALGMDNAFSLSASQTVAGQTVVVNPTAYGHGYLFNDLAKDGPVVYHEGMHSISTPIAGLRAAPEGGAINEGQADLWAYSITEDKVLGNYVVNGWRRRARVRSLGGNPDLRQWIRHADSGLTYSRLGTSGGSNFQVHRDGEIYASAMHDIRELMLMFQTGGPYKRPNFITGEASDSIQLGKETWERIFLGSIYILGTMEPDTFVRTRDAMITADAFLYPSDPLDPQAPGLHRALIEQVFAAHEIGVNAAAPVGGRQTISTNVSDFAISQGKLAPPIGVTVTPASPSSAQVSWQPVGGAFAYEILGREIGKENQRQNAPVTGRPYLDGDGGTDGYLHIDYVNGEQTSYVDNGQIEGGNIRQGLKNPVAFEYVVRALSRNPNKQVGVSDNSLAASVPTAVVDVTNNVRTTIVSGSVSFANGKTEFDQTLQNLGAGNFDGTIYTPIEFRIVSISNPTVTVANADNAGTGRSDKPAGFFFRPVLATGQVSQPRHLVFNNPNTQLFIFDAVVTARVQVDPAAATRYGPEPPPDLSNFEAKTFTEIFTGLVPAMDLGTQLAGGVTYVDVPFTSQDGAIAVTGNMTSTRGIDLDLFLRDSAGNELSSSTSASANEVVTANIQPRTTYVYRVVGWAGAASDFRIESIQSLLVPKSAPAGGATSSLTGITTNLVRFTINPLSGTVMAQIIQ